MENEEVVYEQSAFKKYRVLIVVGLIVLIMAVMIAATMLLAKRTLNLLEDNKPVSLKPGETYTIKWAAGKVDRVSILLYSASDVQWIARDIPANPSVYDWKLFAYQRPGNDFRIVVFEYPWKDGNLVSYSSKKIEILGSKYTSCEDYSVEAEFPYIASNYEGLKKVFISKNGYKGDLGGFEGADKKCNAEAQKLGYSGNYIAFLGNDEVSAKERITVPGVFVLAEASSSLVEGTTCHRLLASNAEKLVEKFALAGETAKIQFSDDFTKNFRLIWVGRLTQNSKKNCVPIGSDQENYSYTLTCQNWSQSKEKIYTGSVPDFAGLDRCYNDAGKSIPANFVGAFSTVVANDGSIGLAGRSCNGALRLFCVEQ